MSDSIQEYLTSIGFTLHSEQGCFAKWINGFQRITVPFTELSGKTVAHFQRRAEQEGWVQSAARPGEIGVGSTADLAETPPFRLWSTQEILAEMQCRMNRIVVQVLDCIKSESF